MHFSTLVRFLFMCFEMHVSLSILWPSWCTPVCWNGTHRPGNKYINVTLGLTSTAPQFLLEPKNWGLCHIRKTLWYKNIYSKLVPIFQCLRKIQTSGTTCSKLVDWTVTGNIRHNIVWIPDCLILCRLWHVTGGQSPASNHRDHGSIPGQRMLNW
jgi:hypothetical protein